MATKSKNVPSRPAPSAPPGFSGLKNLLVPNGAARSASRSRSSFYLDEKAKKNPPPRPPPPKVVPQYIHRSSSLERQQHPRISQSFNTGMGASAVPLLPPPGPIYSKPKINQDLQPLIDLFASPPPSSSSSSPTLTHHSGSDGFSVNSLTLDEDFDPFSPRSLASKQKDSINKLREDSVLTQFKQPDSGLQRQYALLNNHQQENKKPFVAPTPSGPPKLLKKPTVIRTGHPPVAAKPPSLLFANVAGISVKRFDRESSPPEPAVPPPKAPDVAAFLEDDAPPALPPRRPHSEEPFNTEEPHALVLFDYEKSHPDDLGCQAGEVVYLVTKVNDDWYNCRKKVGGEEGMIPATFLDIIHPPRAEDCRTPSPKPPAGVVATALYDFEGECDGDLSFPEGASICVESRINEEWYFGSYQGKRGQFPANFVTPIAASLPQHVP